MPTFTIDVIGVSGSAFGTFTSLGVVGTITYTDEDALGVGDTDPDTETGALPVITAVTGSLPTSWVGQEFGFGWQQQIDGSGSPDALGLRLAGPDINQFISTHLVQHPDGTPIVTGTTYTASEVGNVPGEVIVCFVRETRIKTAAGYVQVEDLEVGDLVMTRDSGYKPIRWIGSKRVSGFRIAQNEKLRPIRISAGALGKGLPERDLLVSRQHRILVSSEIAHSMFDTREVLIPAIKLTEMPGIYIEESIESVEYFHFLFDQHEVVFSEGAPTESLFTGPEAIRAVSSDAKEEIFTLFPELKDKSYKPQPARYIPRRGKEIKQLVERHLVQEIPFL